MGMQMSSGYDVSEQVKFQMIPWFDHMLLFLQKGPKRLVYVYLCKKIKFRGVYARNTTVNSD